MRGCVAEPYVPLYACVVLLLSPHPSSLTQLCLTGYHDINPRLRLTEYLHVPPFLLFTFAVILFFTLRSVAGERSQGAAHQTTTLNDDE